MTVEWPWPQGAPPWAASVSLIRSMRWLWSLTGWSVGAADVWFEVEPG